MKPKGPGRDGWFDYTLTVPCPGSGRFGMTSRVLPADDQWRRASPGYLTWADAGG